jgi:hypothetical protein
MVLSVKYEWDGITNSAKHSPRLLQAVNSGVRQCIPWNLGHSRPTFLATTKPQVLVYLLDIYVVTHPQTCVTLKRTWCHYPYDSHLVAQRQDMSKLDSCPKLSVSWTGRNVQSPQNATNFEAVIDQWSSIRATRKHLRGYVKLKKIYIYIYIYIYYFLIRTE